MTYGIIVKNRFTGKIYEEHDFVSAEGVFQIQDRYLFKPWAKVTIWRYGEEIEWHAK